MPRPAQFLRNQRASWETMGSLINLKNSQPSVLWWYPDQSRQKGQYKRINNTNKHPPITHTGIVKEIKLQLIIKPGR